MLIFINSIMLFSYLYSVNLIYIVIVIKLWLSKLVLATKQHFAMNITGLTCAKRFATKFFDLCENRLLLNIISDHDKLFIIKFWKALTS